jgi:ribosomal protein S18 acetylase RimI-like enzyme
MFITLTYVAMAFLNAYSYATSNSSQGINHMNKTHGSFLAHDIHHNPIVVGWEIIPGQTDRLTEKIKSLSNILVAAYTQTEVEFARTKPEAVAHDFMLKPLAHLLEKDVDWNMFTQQTAVLLEQFFVAFDWKNRSGALENNIFVTAQDQNTGDIVGVMQFLITPEFSQGTIKAALSGVVPSWHNRGLEKILISSIFKIRPDVKVIFLHTRATNQSALDKYQEWGFVRTAEKIPNWVDVEYTTERSDVLQQEANHLIMQR